LDGRVQERAAVRLERLEFAGRDRREEIMEDPPREAEVKDEAACFELLASN
jgi:hypothetical protein